MNMKTKRIASVFGLSVVCIALIAVIAMQFNKEDESSIQADVTTSALEDVKVSIYRDESSGSSETQAVMEKSETESVQTTIIVQDNFSEATKPAEPEKPNVDASGQDNVLTDPATTPAYKESDVTVTSPQETTPQNGDKKDGKIYVNGFGWVENEGGGGVSETNNEMYENGNKIGSME